MMFSNLMCRGGRTWLTLALSAAAASLGVTMAAGQAPSKSACGLLSAAEVGAAIGSKVVAAASNSDTGPAGTAGGIVCRMQSDKASVLLRLAKQSGNGSAAAAKGLAMMKQAGAQVDVRTFGAVTCSTLVPPKNMEQQFGGFNTTCSVTKGGSVAAVEVTAKSANDMVSIDTLRPLAEKMATRF